MCTHTFLVPTQSVVLLESGLADGHDVSSLRMFSPAGSVCTVRPSTGSQKASRLRAYEVYGMTEGFVTRRGPEDWERGKRGVGRAPIYACDVRIIDETGNELPPGETGEIVGYSPGLMTGIPRRAGADRRS